jgi:hypothetical protein
VGSLKSHNPIDLHGLLRDNIFTYLSTIYFSQINCTNFYIFEFLVNISLVAKEYDRHGKQSSSASAGRFPSYLTVESLALFGKRIIDRNKQDEARYRLGPHVTFSRAGIDKLEQRDKCTALSLSFVGLFLI